MSTILANFHFLRPLWLYALLALPLLWWVWKLRQRQADVWRDIVDPHLLPALLQASGRKPSRGIWLALLAYVVAILAMAGPSWRQGEQPLWQTQAPLVIAVDLSSRVSAADLPPSRLLQVRAKLRQLLEARSGGQLALVAYAGEAFTVAPLTDDAANVALFVDALQPDVMPVDGQDAGKAIELAQQLMRRAGFDKGQILLLTDHVDAAALTAAASSRLQGYRVSALGVGTALGASYRDAEGRFQRAALDATSLRGVASAGGGNYQTLTATDTDLRALGVLQAEVTDTSAQRGQKGLAWLDEGYWLLPLLMLLALFAFRRNGVAAVLLLGLCLPVAMPAQAADNWWRRDDQQIHAQAKQGVDAYRQGDFAKAEQAFATMPGADGAYNRGNVLAKQGRYDEAIAAYDQALKLQPGMQDAIANRKAVEAAKKRQQQSGQGQNQRQNPSSQDGQQNTPNNQSQSQSGQQNAGQASAQDSQQKRSQQSSPASQQAQRQANSAQDKTEQAAGADKSSQLDKPTDAQTQRDADQAQRQRMQEAMAKSDGKAEKSKGEHGAKAQAETQEQREQRQAMEAWLRRVPDDPGGLLRAKFRLEYERRQREGR